MRRDDDEPCAHEEMWRRRMERHVDRHMKEHARRHGRPHWHPRSFAEWRMQWAMRRRLFLWFGVAIMLGVGAGHIAHQMSGGKWWAFVATLAVLWMASGAIAFRLTRPLMLVVDAAQRIGDGDLKTRIPVRRQRGELQMLAHAINDMAGRIEKQLADQRALLAAVSHELRTPLGHVRVLVETARDAPGGATPAVLDELEREVLELDRLVDRLLASSRLDFATIERRDADIGALAVGAVEKAGVPPERLAVEGVCTAAVEPTLVRRAIANLLENAETHGGGAVAVRVERRDDTVAVEVDDAGPGVPAADRVRMFTPFERGARGASGNANGNGHGGGHGHEPTPTGEGTVIGGTANGTSNGVNAGGAIDARTGGLGLGLALVARIASAHGGRAWIEERPGGGARAGFSVTVRALVGDAATTASVT